MLKTEKPGLWCSWAENERCKLTERGHDAEVGFAGMTETPRNGRNHPKQSGIKTGTKWEGHLYRFGRLRYEIVSLDSKIMK